MENEKVTEEDLSKAIDDLVEELFGKSNGQPENKFDEIPKDPTDPELKANGGKDVIKAKEEDEEEEEDEKEMESKKAKKAKKMDEEDEEDEEEEMKKKAKKCVQKSNSDFSADSLIKSLQVENESLSKSLSSFQKSFDEKMESIGELFKGLKYEIDMLKSTTSPRKSIKNVDEIKKSFANDEGQKEEKINKSEVEDAIESLVKSNKLTSSAMTEYELFGRIYNPNHSRMVAEEIFKNRKVK